MPACLQQALVNKQADMLSPLCVCVVISSLKQKIVFPVALK